MICTLTGAVAGPVNVFLGVNVIVLFVLSRTYSPSAVVTLFVSEPEASNKVSVSGLSWTCSAPLLKFTVLALSASASTVSNTILDTCCLPWTSVVSEASFVGVTGVISGVYVVWTFTPFDPVTCTATGSTSPV